MKKKKTEGYSVVGIIVDKGKEDFAIKLFSRVFYPGTEVLVWERVDYKPEVEYDEDLAKISVDDVFGQPIYRKGLRVQKWQGKKKSEEDLGDK